MINIICGVSFKDRSFGIAWPWQKQFGSLQFEPCLQDDMPVPWSTGAPQRLHQSVRTNGGIIVVGESNQALNHGAIVVPEFLEWIDSVSLRNLDFVGLLVLVGGFLVVVVVAIVVVVEAEVVVEVAVVGVVVVVVGGGVVVDVVVVVVFVVDDVVGKVVVRRFVEADIVRFLVADVVSLLASTGLLLLDVFGRLLHHGRLFLRADGLLHLTGRAVGLFFIVVVGLLVVEVMEVAEFAWIFCDSFVDGVFAVAGSRKAQELDNWYPGLVCLYLCITIQENK